MTASLLQRDAVLSQKSQIVWRKDADITEKKRIIAEYNNNDIAYPFRK